MSSWPWLWLWEWLFFRMPSAGTYLTTEETIMPGSEYSQSRDRAWDYPVGQLQMALSNPNWVTGNGIGTGSLGAQYVAKIMEVPSAGNWVESGYGNLIMEMGILGPILWLIWTVSLMWAALRTTLKLRGTWAFPVALSILWFAFILLFPFTWGSLGSLSELRP